MLKPSFWDGRRVLLTGHTGFKGSWLALWLSQLGADLCGVALEPSTSPALFDQLDLAKQCTFHQLFDISDYASLSSVVSNCTFGALTYLLKGEGAPGKEGLMR